MVATRGAGVCVCGGSYQQWPQGFQPALPAAIVSTVPFGSLLLAGALSLASGRPRLMPHWQLISNQQFTQMFGTLANHWQYE